MDISIGIRNVSRELSLEIDGEPSAVTEIVTAAISGGTALTLSDAKGRTVVVPPDALGYVIVGDAEERRVGFAL
nr:DUF3107 domain-containing protein [Actinomycetales bacterium]